MHSDLDQQRNAAIIYQSLDEIDSLLSALEAKSRLGASNQVDRDTVESPLLENPLQQREHCFTPNVLEDASLCIDEFNMFEEA